MKTKVNSNRLLVFASTIFALTLSARAENPENVSLSVMPGMRVVVTAQNPIGQPMSIQIINSQTNEMVYKANLPQVDQYSQIYNLSELPKGGYTLTFQISNKVYEHELLTGGSDMILLAETVYTLPTFYQKDNKLLVTLLDPEKEKVKVSFWKNTESFFTDQMEVTGSFRRNYNLQNLEPGTYYVEVQDGSKRYDYNLLIQ
jgi:hypothetical protein